jgi:hypothetical protein
MMWAAYNSYGDLIADAPTISELERACLLKGYWIWDEEVYLVS